MSYSETILSPASLRPTDSPSASPLRLDGSPQVRDRSKSYIQTDCSHVSDSDIIASDISASSVEFESVPDLSQLHPIPPIPKTIPKADETIPQIDQCGHSHCSYFDGYDTISDRNDNPAINIFL